MKKFLFLLVFIPLVSFGQEQSPTEFFNTCGSDVLIEKARWGKHKIMEEMLKQNFNNEPFNPSGYIFYKRYKEKIIKFGPLKISKSVYNKIKSEGLKLGYGAIITESITSRGEDIYLEAQRKYFESIRNNLKDSIITVSIKLDLKRNN